MVPEEQQMKNILISVPCITQKHRERFIQAAEGCSVRFVKKEDVTPADVEWADIVMGNVKPDLLRGRKTEFMQLESSGADAYVKEGVLDPSTVLTCCTGAYSQAVAEHSLAATLMLMKNLHLYRDLQYSGKWGDAAPVSSISDSTVIVVGLGEIGRYYARMVKALGAYVIGLNRRGGEKPDCVDELYTMDSFNDVIGRGDIILSVLPGTPATEHFFTEERFALMKPSAIFLNSGRGTAVSEQTLYKVLSEKVIACAAVDVFEREPLPEDSPLWGLDNLLLTPHASGFFHLPATIERVVDICERNLRAWLTGGDLVNVVDFSTGYRK